MLLLHVKAFDFFPQHGPPEWEELLFEGNKRGAWKLMIRPTFLHRRKLNPINQKSPQKMSVRKPDKKETKCLL